MEDTRKQGFHTVETNVEEMEQKIKEHRKKNLIRAAIAGVIVLLLFAGGYIYLQLKEYTSYEVQMSVERKNSEATHYENFGGNILRYNNDGAFYEDTADNLIWNQAYEMQNPMSDICENYIAIADKLGTRIYIMNTTGVQGQIETSKPIEAVCVANQGTTAVLTQEDGTSYLELYAKNGESLASGQIHMVNSGYPLDIALSNDGTKLAVSILDISDGIAKTTIAFYNFGSVGQNEIDNIVGSYSYKDTIIPEIDFVSNDRLLAFGDHQVIFFEGTQKPKEKLSVKLEKQMKSVFFDKDYFGVVYGNKDSAEKNTMQIYDMKGKLRLEKGFKMPYQKIEFLQNHEICISEDNSCEIYSLKGVKRFSYKFDIPVYKILSGKNKREYTFILNGIMEKVKLK